MKLRHTLVGTGWSETIIEDGEREITIRASYLSDALGNLSRGAIAVARGSPEVRFSFDEEPGEYRWILKKRADESYNWRLLWFGELWGNEPDTSGTAVFECSVSRTVFSMAVLKALEDVRHKYGEEEYREKWVEHDFPAKELIELRSLIAQ